jgi:hypothetical protein
MAVANTNIMILEKRKRFAKKASKKSSKKQR